ncbi:MAG: hypothetical protein LBR28_03950 [Bacteroidales bacterium]|jgi:hypothetical protein|nr:hypothetical protein [Bacteroidales bacterium]
MKLLKVKNVAIIAILSAVIFVACNKNAQTETQTTSTSTAVSMEVKNDLGLTKDFNGKYPSDVKLFENTSLMKRLEKLLGTENYKFFTELQKVETPIDCNDSLFVAHVCKAHDCADNSFTVVYEFANDNLSIYCIKAGKQIELSENGKMPVNFKFQR